MEERRRPVLLQTRAQHGITSSTAQVPAPLRKTKLKQRKQDTVIEKQRKSPLSSWIGKQLLGQIIPQKRLDDEGNLQMMEN
jgi:hypothetical protein